MNGMYPNRITLYLSTTNWTMGYCLHLKSFNLSRCLSLWKLDCSLCTSLARLGVNKRSSLREVDYENTACARKGKNTSSISPQQMKGIYPLFE